MTATNLNIFYKRRKLFWSLASATLCLIIAYLYLVNSTVFTLVAREKLATTLTEKQNAVIALETEYLALTNNVTLERATELGFRDAARETIFVRAASLPTLSYAGH